MEKTIWKVFGLIVIAFLMFGIIVPQFISAKSDVGVLIGVVLSVATIYFIIKKSLKLINKNKNNETYF